MAVSNEQFLFCCIENSHGGTVNWQIVADACGIPTKGAAAIKYRRMKEKFGTISDGDSKASATPTKGGTPAADGEEKKTKKTPTKKATANKKRKVDDEADVEEKQITVKDEDEEVAE